MRVRDFPFVVLAVLSLICVDRVHAADGDGFGTWVLSNTFANGQILTATQLTANFNDPKTFWDDTVLQGGRHFTITATDTGVVKGKLALGQANRTESAWGLDGVSFSQSSATYTDDTTAGSGTVTNAHINTFAIPTIAAANALVTATNAATWYIAGPPAAGTNVTITNPYALWIDDGTVRLDGALTVAGAITASGGIDGVLGGVTPAPITGTTGNFSDTITGVDADLSGDLTVASSATFPADSSWATMPDTTFTAESGSKIIIGSLYDQATCWDRDAFHAISRNTSWYGRTDTLATFPDEYAIWITTGQDSLVVWDRQTSKEWMVFVEAVDNWNYGVANINDLAFLDGTIWLADAGNGAQRLDLIRDRMDWWQTAGHYVLSTGVSGRNSEAGAGVIYNSSLAIVNDAVNAVAVIRDPEGSTDEFGRPKQIFKVATDGGPSVSTAGITAIYDGVAHASSDVLIRSDGYHFTARNNATIDILSYDDGTVQGVSADAFTNYGAWYNGGSGGGDIPWTNSASTSGIAAMENRSVALNGAHIMVWGSDEGLMISHSTVDASAANSGDNNQLTFTLDDDEVNPVWSGTGSKMRSWNFEDVNDTFGNALTNNNSVTFTTAGIQGDCASFTAASSMYLSEAHSADFALSTSATVAGWIRSPNTGAAMGIIGCYDSATPSNGGWKLEVASDRIYATVYGSSIHQVSSAAGTLSDNTWAFVAWTYDGVTEKVYIDGELSGTAALTASIVDSPSPLIVGADINGAGFEYYFDGDIDQLFFCDRALSPEEIKWIYRQGEEQRQSTVSANDALASDDIDYISVSGDLIAAGDEDSVTVLSARGVPIAVHGSPGGNIQDVSIRQIPGTTDYELAIATTTRVQWIAPDRKISEPAGTVAKALYGPAIWNPRFIGEGNFRTFDAIVDSAGNGDYTNVQDAIDALGAGANIYVRSGTYPPFDIDVPNVQIVGAGGTMGSAATAVTIIDGGETDDAIDVTSVGDRSTIRNLCVKTTAGAGNVYDGIEVASGANYVSIISVSVVESDASGFLLDANYASVQNCTLMSVDGTQIHMSSTLQRVQNSIFTGSATYAMELDNGAAYGLITGNQFIVTCTDYISSDAPQTNITGNSFYASCTSNCVQLLDEGDNSIIVGNMMMDSGTCIEVNASAENCSLAPNVINGTVNDNSGTSTADGSNEIF